MSAHEDFCGSHTGDACDCDPRVMALISSQPNSVSIEERRANAYVLLGIADAVDPRAEQLQAVRDLIAHARLVSPSERAVIYVAELERALGIDAPVPHKLGGNDA